MVAIDGHLLSDALKWYYKSAAAEQPGEARATMGPIVIKAGRVYDGVADRALEHAYVVVDGNTITAVGPQTELAGSAERFAQVLDLARE